MTATRILTTLIVLAVLAAFWLAPDRREEPTSGSGGGGMDLSSLIGAGSSIAPQEFARALEPRTFRFPDDHGAHPDYRNEWWYFTGNLTDPAGRRFGYQWVVFRMALSAHPYPRDSDWGANQAFMAHFALTDPDGQEFHAFERFARGAAGLAGAQTAPLKVWLEDWSLQDDAQGTWRLEARAGDVELALSLHPRKPVVLNGDRGLSRKSAGIGNASYYYSLSRIESRGILRIADRRHEVSGHSWLDREWGTSALAGDQQGWDWFALQLDDCTDLMFYQLRRKDGTIDPFSKGTLIAASGAYSGLAVDDVTLEVLATWTSPRGVTYPSAWRMRVPQHELSIEIRPVIPNQELDLSVKYWEGAVDVSGRRGDRDIAGRGYVELVGYD